MKGSDVVPEGGSAMDNGACSYRRFLDGDESAFDEIMKELFDNLLFFIDRYVHDIHTAEDIAIDTFSDLLVHKHRYNFKVSLKTYLFMLGRSRALNYIKHRKVIDFVELSEANEVFGDQAALEDMILADERKRLVNRALRRLPEDMRVVIHLIYFEDLSYHEAAKVMKKNPKQVDNLLYRAKKELRIILGKDGEL
jgi:RNA polymerase sigma-70 factor (ECF subfamily)